LLTWGSNACRLLNEDGLALLALAVFWMFLNWGALGLTVKLGDFTRLLAPLAFALAVIERAVEILVSPWRDAEANKLERVAAAIKSRPSDPGTNAQNAADLQAASDASDHGLHAIHGNPLRAHVIAWHDALVNRQIDRATILGCRHQRRKGRKPESCFRLRREHDDRRRGKLRNQKPPL
jgi:hypothetical protein